MSSGENQEHQTLIGTGVILTKNAKVMLMEKRYLKQIECNIQLTEAF